ncbi:biliverdin-producing heme oxygenase [Methylobacterium sp. E-045]|uniref:biliverdin-producing heme oxygenase n=1 Tax=Methylobacterium sp. E-045 TaxID=2836575 RepID=UPI001FB98816|nr:biliverdin-producing heme oxygenase [Methylobacterium sp. E-045]MCJ2127920.1 biliverdin-producing heme oxygenase [Methylobacterium sp. E-045]
MSRAAHTSTDLAHPALSERLREETRASHEDLEHRLDWRRRMATREGYLALLTRWWGFHRVFEPAVAASFGPAFAQPRGKLHLLERDLVHFGLTPDAIAALPRFAAGTGFQTRPALLGALYVTEGSTLGGQVIAHHIRHSLGSEIAAGGCAYYEGYGKRETGAMWASFRTFLDRSGEEGPSHHVVEGARWTFDALKLWLTGGHPANSGPTGPSHH